MTASCGSPSEFESYSHFAHESPQLDFSFLSSHDTSKDHHVPALFNGALSDDMPSLGLTGDTNMDDSPTMGDQVIPRKRHRGERIVWTPEEDDYLRKAVHVYGDKTEKWAKIAACVPGRTNKNCRKRWFHSLDPSLKKGGWTEEEDHLLRTGVQKFRGQWSKIAERIQGRTDDQCAKRWRESLDPDIDRAAWTAEDDLLLLQKFEEFGTQWQKIAALSFPGRPGLHCRNRWRKIQRSLNHMQRANRRRRNQLSHKDRASGSEHRAELQNDLDDGSEKQPGRLDSRLMTADDVMLQDAYLDDEYSLLEDSVDPADGKSDSSADEDRPYGCAIPDCNFESSSPSLLFYHFKASHHGTTVLKPFRCTMPGCEDRKRYKNINGLQYHVNHAKNTPGHSGHGNAPQDSHQVNSSPTALPTTTLSNETNSLTAAGSARRMSSTGFVKPAHTSLSSIPTPAQLQSLIPPSLPQPLVSHQAFNIPHTPESMEEPLMASPMSCDVSLPHSHSTSLQCPELGCGQIFHSLTGLTSHMASNHGHQSMTMESNESTSAYGSESITIPENDYDDIDLDMDLDIDMDMDLACLASENSSFVLQTASTLLDQHRKQQHLRLQLDLLSREQETLSLGDQNTAHHILASQELDILSMNELLFANHIANSLSSLNSINITSGFNNRIHFGTYINVSADDPLTLPSTPVTSANVSPRLSAAAINIPADAALESMTTSAPVTAGMTSVVLKKFPCLAVGCTKSYGSTSAMRTHMKNEHPGAYTKPGRSKSASASPRAIECKIAPGPLPTSFSSFASVIQSLDARSPLSPESPDTATTAASTASPVSDSDGFGNSVGTAKTFVHHRQAKKPDEGADKPFKCLVPGCGKGYTNINGLKNHLLQAHGSTPAKKSSS